MKKDSIIFGLSASKELAQSVSSHSGIELGELNIKKFNDGETYIEVLNSVRGKVVFVFQSTSFPANDNLIELFLLIDALKRSSASEINLIIPYFGYARQDRRVGKRSPISAKLISKFLQEAGATRVITFDLHSSQIEGFFDIPVDDIWTTRFFVKEVKKLKIKDLTIVSPDNGGIPRARTFSTLLSSPLAVIDKRRVVHGEVVSDKVLGDVEGRNVLLVDDMIDTGGTIIEALKLLKSKGAKDIYIAVAHLIFSKYKENNLIEKFKKYGVKNISCANTIQGLNKIDKMIKIVDLSNPLSNILLLLLDKKSLSKYFYKKYEK